MARPVTLCTMQWGDLPLEVVCEKAKSFGFDGVELGYLLIWMFGGQIRNIIGISKRHSINTI